MYNTTGHFSLFLIPLFIMQTCQRLGNLKTVREGGKKEYQQGSELQPDRVSYNG